MLCQGAACLALALVLLSLLSLLSATFGRSRECPFHMSGSVRLYRRVRACINARTFSTTATTLTSAPSSGRIWLLQDCFWQAARSVFVLSRDFAWRFVCPVFRYSGREVEKVVTIQRWFTAVLELESTNSFLSVPPSFLPGRLCCGLQP